ncbi:MAG: 16S rRNA (cytidine(1402)-2'-O)-methyltransferase [gamma proteobacterium symbiont of Bathyaustriella thionipta]|nr:16S rRNA (cytidine(1402)-2'-O)-methyltransferase [gamma proteobacterium symbiont of Bathyaustriella thionipta]
MESGILYVIATPIGNRADISERALQVLRDVDRVLAEDTRHSGKLLSFLGLKKPMLAVHEHNERGQLQYLLAELQAGKSLGLISDAGTPLISDPGYPLVRFLREQGIQISPIPGASALTAALSVAGQPTDRFVFEGFLPRAGTARQARLQQLALETRTIVLYESVRRIDQTLHDLVEVLEADRKATLCRELTKLHETILYGGLQRLREQFQAHPDQQRGELVLVVHGLKIDEQSEENVRQAHELLALLLQELPLKKAARLVAQYSGLPKNQLYQAGLKLNQ